MRNIGIIDLVCLILERKSIEFWCSGFLEESRNFIAIKIIYIKKKLNDLTN